MAASAIPHEDQKVRSFIVAVLWHYSKSAFVDDDVHHGNVVLSLDVLREISLDNQDLEPLWKAARQPGY